MIRRNKRGSLEDLFLIAIIIFLFGVSSIVGVMLYDNFKDNPIMTSTAEGNQTFAKVGSAITTVDNLILFAIVLTAIIVIILASTLKLSPAFFILGFILFIVAIILAMVLSNSYETITNTTAFTNQSIDLPKTDFLLSKLPFFIFGFGLIIMVVLYAKWNWSG